MTFAPDLVGTYQDSDGGGGRHCPSRFFNGNSSWSGGSRLCPFFSCFVGQPLALNALKRDVRALHVIDADLNPRVHSEIKFGQVAVEMLGIDVLVNADNAALENAEKPFKRIGMHVAARTFEFRMM